jgi:hypothetical protein
MIASISLVGVEAPYETVPPAEAGSGVFLALFRGLYAHGSDK